MPRNPTDRLNALNRPKPIRVEADAKGKPIAVYNRVKERVAVVEIVDRWRINDEWWRVEHGGEVHREYWRILLANDVRCDIFQDLMKPGKWFLQTVGQPLENPADSWAPRVSG